jgi:hypothetical protein
MLLVTFGVIIQVVETAFQHICGTSLMVFYLAPNEIKAEKSYNQFNCLLDETGE